jgi:TetR/AcrR family transcriptional regulator, ethionamide resistance regulator
VSSLVRSARSRTERRETARGVLLAAVQEILEEGISYSAIKVEDLAARAGISRAGFYRHFRDKLDLLQKWLGDTRVTLVAVCDRWYAADPGLDRATLRAALDEIFSAYRDRMTLLAAMHEVALYDADLRDAYADAFAIHCDALTAHIEAGQRSGDINADLLARETAESLICLIERPPAQIPHDASDEELRLRVDAATSLVWSTLYAPAPNRKAG